MPKGLFNWTFDKVVDFLKEHNFSLNYVNSSHYYYRGFVDGKMRQVCIPYAVPLYFIVKLPRPQKLFGNR